MFTFPKFKNTLSVFRRGNNTKQDKNFDIINILCKNFMIDGTDIKWEDTFEFTFPIKGGFYFFI